MKRQITAIIVGTVLAITGSTLSVSAATTAQKTNLTLNSISNLATGDLVGGINDINSSSEQLCSPELTDAQTIGYRKDRSRKG